MKVEKALSLEECQQANLTSLVEFDKLCRKNKWTYFLAYGTLLGAIRHKGFIPWDDDIDVFMPRKDFEKFIIYMGDEMKNGYKLCTRKNTKNYLYYIPRFCNMNYRYETTYDEKSYDIGAFIDIYPLDNYCNTEKQGKKLTKSILRNHKLYSIYMNDNYDTKTIKTIILKLLHICLKFYYKNRYLYINEKKINKLLKKYTSNKDKFVGVPTWANDTVQHKRELFSERIETEFEGHYFFVPKHYVDLLKDIYNDYMTLPEESKRKPNHSYKLYNR